MAFGGNALDYLTHQLGCPVGGVWPSQPIHGVDDGLVSVGRPEGFIISLQIVDGKLAVVVPASLGSLVKAYSLGRSAHLQLLMLPSAFPREC